MNIRAPEDRGPTPAKKKKKRSETYRPSHLIRETLEGLGNSAQAPAGVLAGLVAAAQPYIDDGQTRQTDDYLHDVYGEHRSRNLLRSGASMHSSPVRLDRDYWGIGRQELADALDVSAQEVEDIEQGTEAPLQVIRMIEKLGHARVAIARQRWVDQFEPPEPTTVQNLILHLQRKAGSFASVVQALTANRHDTKRGLSVPMLNSFLDGSDVPSWALLQRICQQSELLDFPEKDAEPTEGNEVNIYTQLWQDWCVRYADFLRNSGVTAPLARSLQHLFAQSTESMREFVAQNMAVSYPTQTRIMQRLEAGEKVEWTQVSRTLDAAGLSPDSPFYLYIKGLHANGKVAEGIALAQQNRDTQVFDAESYAFGLTSKERRVNRLSLPAAAKTKRTQDA
jgi:transcriptional regulator with XRE-family HTH domain